MPLSPSLPCSGMLLYIGIFDTNHFNWFCFNYMHDLLLTGKDLQREWMAYGVYRIVIVYSITLVWVTIIYSITLVCKIARNKSQRRLHTLVCSNSAAEHTVEYIWPAWNYPSLVTHCCQETDFEGHQVPLWDTFNFRFSFLFDFVEFGSQHLHLRT